PASPSADSGSRSPSPSAHLELQRPSPADPRRRLANFTFLYLPEKRRKRREPTQRVGAQALRRLPRSLLKNVPCLSVFRRSMISSETRSPLCGTMLNWPGPSPPRRVDGPRPPPPPRGLLRQYQ